MVVVALAIVTMVACWWTHPATSTITLLIPLLVLVLPYSHQYDSITLLPALAVTGHQPMPHLMARAHFWVFVFLVTVTPVLALSTVPIPFRLLPLGLVLRITFGFMVERRRRHGDNYVRLSAGGAAPTARGLTLP